jgi:peptide-methionine (S)-S-oxide reductase
MDGMGISNKTGMVERDRALRGRAASTPVASRHAIHGTPMEGPFPGMEMALFGMGCFWGAEKGFWLLPGVHSTSVGYAGGYTPNASYEEVCSGQTGHAEVVRVVFDPTITSYDAMLKQFWEGHDPTQGTRQGADIGTQYRSAIYYYSEDQRQAAERSRDVYQTRLTAAGYGPITTEITSAPEYFFAEDYHQQYLAKNPRGYCGHGGTGVSCPVGVESLSRP